MTPVTVAALVLALATLSSGAVHAQDHNYVPGWANTYNHMRSGGERSELPGESELMARLRAVSPQARCAIEAIDQPDRNVLVNRYRRNERQQGEASAFRTAVAMVEAHVTRLRAQGQCR